MNNLLDFFINRVEDTVLKPGGLSLGISIKHRLGFEHRDAWNNRRSRACAYSKFLDNEAEMIIYAEDG